MAVHHNLVNIFLLLREAAANGRGTRIVRTVVLVSLCARVAKHKATGLKGARRRIAVHDFPVHSDDALERRDRTVGHSDTVDSASDELLRHARLAETHRRCVHFITNDSSAFELFDFFCRLLAALFNNRLDERQRGSRTLLRWMDMQQIHDLNLRVVAIGREEMNLTSLFDGFVYDVGHAAHRSMIGNTCFLRQVAHRLYATVPHNVVDVNLVAAKNLVVRVGIHDANQSFAVLCEIVEERAILPILIGVRRIVHRCIIIAKEQNDAVAHELPKFLAALNVSLFAE